MSFHPIRPWRKGFCGFTTLVLSLMLLAGPAMAQIPAHPAEGKGGNSPIVSVLAILAILLAMLLLKTASVAAAMLAEVLYPDAVLRARARIQANPVRCFTLGLADAVAVLVIFFLLATLCSRFVLLMPALPVFVISVMGLLFLGLAGIYGSIGSRMGQVGVERRAASEILRGGALLETATMMPLLGWLACIIAICMALGAGVLHLFQPKKTAAPDLPPPREIEPGMDA